MTAFIGKALADASYSFEVTDPGQHGIAGTGIDHDYGQGVRDPRHISWQLCRRYSNKDEEHLQHQNDQDHGKIQSHD